MILFEAHGATVEIEKSQLRPRLDMDPNAC